MKIDDKIEYVKMGLIGVGITADNLTCEYIYELVNYINKTKEEAKLRDIVKLKLGLVNKYEALNERLKQLTKEENE